MHDVTVLEDETDDAYIHTYIHTTDADRQTNRHPQTDRHRQIGRQTLDKQTNKHKYKQTHEHTSTRVHNPDLETEQTQSYGNNIAITM